MMEVLLYTSLLLLLSVELESFESFESFDEGWVFSSVFYQRRFIYFVVKSLDV